MVNFNTIDKDYIVRWQSDLESNKRKTPSQVHKPSQDQKNQPHWEELEILLKGAWMVCVYLNMTVPCFVFRSISHLREAAHADGKAEFSLQKLKLFKQFYILVGLWVYYLQTVLYTGRLMIIIFLSSSKHSCTVWAKFCNICFVVVFLWEGGRRGICCFGHFRLWFGHLSY